MSEYSDSSASLNIPFTEDEALTREEAARFAGRTVRTIDLYMSRWPEMVERRFGRVYISKVALEMLRRRDTYALRLYGAGERTSPVVSRYYLELGVTPPASIGAGA